MKLLVSFILTLLIQGSLAQTPVSESFNSQNGFGSNTVYHIMEDRQHFLWISTDACVAKYDGTSFRYFTVNDGIPDSDIFGTFQDSKGRVWLRTYNGKAAYILDDKVYSSQNDDLCASLGTQSIILAIYEVGNTIYFISDQRIIMLKDKEVINLEVQDDRIRGSAIINNQVVVWTPGIIDGAEDHNITCMQQGQKSFFYTFQHDTATFFNFKNALYKVINVKKNEVQKVFSFPDSKTEILSGIQIDSTLYIGTRKGIFLIDEQWKIKAHLYTDKAITSLHLDFQGGLWVSTLNSGIFHVRSINEPLIYYDDRLKDIGVTALSVDSSSRIWVGAKDDNFAIINGPEINWYNVPAYNFAKDHVTSFYHYKGKTLILGKRFLAQFTDYGLSHVVAATGNDLIIRNDTMLWVGGFDLVVTDGLDSEGNLLPSIETSSKIDFHKPILQIKAIDDKVYFGTLHGLYLFENDTVILANEIPEISIIALTDTFLLTQKGELYQLKNNGYSPFKKISYSGASILSYDLVETIHHLFIGTANGVYVIRKSDKKLFHITQTRGVRVKHIALYNNELLLGTERGLLSVTFRENQIDIPKPIINISSVSINGQNSSVSSTYDLRYDQNVINISYSGISYDYEPDYIYRINDGEWNQCMGGNLALQLEPGNYIVELASYNRSGEIKSPIASTSISFVIHASFWRTGWFYTLVISFFAAIFILYYYLNLSRVNTEKKIVQLEHKALRMQMNPHFIFNAINSIKGFYVKGRTKEASLYINHFAKLLRSILEAENTFTSLDSELAMLENYIGMVKMRFHNLEYEVVVSSNIKPEKIKIPNLLLQPFIENAVIHGLSPNEGQGKITLEITREDGFLFFFIRDNGIGIKENPDHDKKPISIQLSRERVQLFNGSKMNPIHVANLVDSKGVQVIIKLRYEEI